MTILPFIMKAVIAGLVEHPYLNATLDDESEEVILIKYYNIGVAMDSPEGLMVPVVKNAKDKSIFQLAEELTQLAEKAETGPLIWLISREGLSPSATTELSEDSRELRSSIIRRWPFWAWAKLRTCRS